MLLDDNIGGEFLELANTCSEIRGTGSACGGGETGSSSSFIAVSKKKKSYFERVVDRLPLMTYGLKLSLEA